MVLYHQEKKCETILDNIKNTNYKDKQKSAIIKNITSNPVVFQKADKTNTIAVLDKEDYNNRMT